MADKKVASKEHLMVATSVALKVASLDFLLAVERVDCLVIL
jgi:hypothetical protein